MVSYGDIKHIQNLWTITTMDRVIEIKPVISQRIQGIISPNYVCISGRVPVLLSLICVYVGILESELNA